MKYTSPFSVYAISQLSGSGPSSSLSSGLGTVIFGDNPSSLGASIGASAGLLCGAMSPEASVLLSSCSLDSEATRGQDESGTLLLREEQRMRTVKDKGGGVRKRRLIESQG